MALERTVALALGIAGLTALGIASPASAQYGSAMSGTTATLTGDAASDVLVVDVVGGLLHHNRRTAGDAGFNSDFDWDSVTPGDQTLTGTSLVTLTVNAGDGDDMLQTGSSTAPATTASTRVTFNGEGGVDTLVWEDTVDPTGRQVNVEGGIFNQVSVPFTGFSVTWVAAGAAPAEQVLVHAGNAADTVNVTGSTAGTATTVDAGGGHDTLNAGSRTAQSSLDLLAGPVTLAGNVGSDTLVIDEHDNPIGHTFALGAATLQRDGIAALGFNGFEGLSLTLGDGNDVLAATSDAPGFSVTGGDGSDSLMGGGGADVLDGGNGDDTLDSHDTMLDIDRCGAGVDHVTADDFDGIETDCEQFARTAPGPIVPPPPPAVTLTRLAIRPASFAAAKRGASVARRRPVGAKVTYVLSAPATVRFTVERAQPGRRGRGARCLAPSAASRRRRACTRYVVLRGSFTDSGLAGPNDFRFSGRLGSRALPAGSYRLVATPPSVGGRAGAASSVRFAIVR